jgi:hypothetical protein
LGDRLSTFNLAGIGHAQVVVEVFRRAGPNLTRRGFPDAIPTLRDFPTDTWRRLHLHQGRKPLLQNVGLAPDGAGRPVKVIDVAQVELAALTRRARLAGCCPT